MEDLQTQPLPTADYTEHERLVCLAYARKFDWEDEEHIADDEFYSSDDEVLPNTFENVKRFLRQVRESKGYDVDCGPPPRFSSPFVPMPGFRNNKKEYERVMEATELTIQKINADQELMDMTNKTYKLVDIEKVVWTRNRMFFLTFTAKEVVAGAEEDAKEVMADAKYAKKVVADAKDAKKVVVDTEDADADAKDVVVANTGDAVVKTFQAMVFLPYPDDPVVLEWKLKPGVLLPDDHAEAGLV